MRAVRYAVAALVVFGCRDKSALPASEAGAPIASATAPPCTPRSAEKLGFPFVRICAPGRAGFWINAAPMGCSAGEHDEIHCPSVTALAHPVGEKPAPLRSAMAALVDKDSAARLCYFRKGGHLATRDERAAARAAMGLATVLVTESESESGRFRFDEIPEWVFEETGEACENGLPAETCHFGWYPAAARSPAVAWDAVRECDARFVAAQPSGIARARIGEACPSPPLAFDGGDRAPLPCALASPAAAEHGADSSAAFLLSCAGPRPRVHPKTEDKDTAAYRCVIPESALGTFDVPGR